MESWQVAMVTVAALLAGALIPVLFQVVLTLRAVRAAAEQAGPALVALKATAERLEWLSARIGEGGRVDRALEAIDGLSQTVGKLQETARLASTVGAAVVPAVAAAVHAWRAAREDDGAAEEPSDAAGGEAARP
jgi:hypothetical protein